MRKVKIMLTAIGVLAIVGGALAFKVNKRCTGTYCTTTIAGGNVCIVFSPDTRFTTTVGGTNVKYVRVFGPNCNTQPACTATGFKNC